MKAKRGDVVFVMHHNSLVSRLIAWFMQSQWSHSALVVDKSVDEPGWLSETTDTQVAYGRLSSYINDSRCTVEIMRPVGVKSKFIDQGIAEAENNTGLLYAYWQLLSWAVVCLAARVGLNLPNILPIGWICNSHVLDAVRFYPIGPFYGIDPRSIHTGRMYKLMKASKQWKSVFVKSGGLNGTVSSIRH